jgi:hypothetical protein
MAVFSLEMGDVRFPAGSVADIAGELGTCKAGETHLWIANSADSTSWSTMPARALPIKPQRHILLRPRGPCPFPLHARRIGLNGFTEAFDAGPSQRQCAHLFHHAGQCRCRISPVQPQENPDPPHPVWMIAPEVRMPKWPDDKHAVQCGTTLSFTNFLFLEGTDLKYGARHLAGPAK